MLLHYGADQSLAIVPLGAPQLREVPSVTSSLGGESMLGLGREASTWGLDEDDSFKTRRVDSEQDLPPEAQPRTRDRSESTFHDFSYAASPPRPQMSGFEPVPDDSVRDERV